MKCCTRPGTVRPGYPSRLTHWQSSNVLSKNETVSLGEIERLVAGQHHDPHSVLGAHPAPGEGPVVEGTVIRALRPLATSVTAVLPDGSRHPMTHRHLGVFEVMVPGEAESVRDYRLEVAYVNGDEPQLQDDPYRHLPTVGELDLYLIGEGRHEELWRALGAHVRHYGVGQPSGTGEHSATGEHSGASPFGEEITGSSFAVWAPNARGVRVAGDFNFWNGQAHPMRSLGTSGVWGLFVPGIDSGAKYKFWVCGQDGIWREKADPMASYAEVPPATASVVFESA